MPLNAVLPGLRGARTTAYVLVAAVAPASIAQAAPNPGGAYSSPTPVVSSLQCRTACAGASYAQPGSVLLIRGRNLEGSELVTFAGLEAAGDEVTVEPERVAAKRLTVRVPTGAVSGPVVVTNGDGAGSAPVRASRLHVEAVETRSVGSGAGPKVEIAVTGRKVFFDADRRPTLTYMVRAEPAHVIVQLTRLSDGVAVARWDQGIVVPDAPGLVSWDGLTDGVVSKEGRYEFHIYAENSAGARASSAPSAPAAGPDSFIFLRHRFPIRGAHAYGTGTAAFGGGRGHQGLDVFAECGTPLVAARGGTVKFKDFQSRAGNYVVIDGEATDVDYVYMHLQDAAMVSKGDRVRTGQQIGFVGDTGHADGCHLHFELWNGAGWYTGGRVFDPTPHLKAWDRFS